jgi:hypothetical protein
VRAAQWGIALAIVGLGISEVVTFAFFTFDGGSV